VERPHVYADATALIGLARIDRLDLLTLLRTPIRVTTYVWEEAATDPAKPGTPALIQARDEGLLVVVREGDPAAFPELDDGESAVLSAAAATRAAVVLDERRARAVITRNANLQGAIVSVTGIIGLILLAKERGRVPAVRSLPDDLVHQGFRISPALYRDALRRAGER
jgi:predicted nucleic acid-binding protein